MGAIDIFLIWVLLIVIALALRATFRRRKNGGCSCGSGSCGSCGICNAGPDKNGCKCNVGCVCDNCGDEKSERSL